MAGMQNDAIRRLLEKGLAHHREGRLVEADLAYREILAVSPQHIDSLNLSGLVAHQRGFYGDAIKLIGAAIALSKIRPVAALHNNIGVAYRANAEFDRAIGHFSQAIALKPAYVEAHVNLGAALKDHGLLREAEASCLRARDLAPRSSIVHFALGAVFQQQGRPLEAAACYEQALTIEPDHRDALTNLGAVLIDMGHVEAAVGQCRRATVIAPEHPNAWYNLGLALQRQGSTDEALSCYARACQLKPDYADAHWNESLLRLSLGDFVAGWRKYEWRWRRSGRAMREFAKPLWGGGEVRGKTVLIHAEQGLGDTLQFVRYAKLVRERAGHVIVECQPGLARLLEGVAGIDCLVNRGDPLPTFDYHVPMLSLPGLLGSTLENIPAETPYLHAQPDAVDRWRRTLGGGPSLKVGLVWRGNQKNTYDRQRSVPVDIFAEFSAPGVEWCILQQDAQPVEIELISRRGNVRDCGPQLTNWTETAALVSALDLVITVDTAVAHLAGALGRPAWVLLASNPHWCWLRQRDDSPWYPTLRLLRQATPGDWRPVLMCAGRDLARLGAENRRSGSNAAGSTNLTDIRNP